MNLEAIKRRSTQLLSLIVLLLIWTVASLYIGPDIFPPPVKVLPKSFELVISGDFMAPLYSSFSRMALGFLLALSVGTGIGIAASQKSMAESMSSLWFPILMSTPSLVIIFTAIMILGISQLTVILVVGFIVFPFIAVDVRDCMKDLDPELLEMADSFRASTIQKVKDIFIPYLVPPLLASSRIGFSLAWKIVVLSEVFGFSTGIGYLIKLKYLQYDLRMLMAWLIIFLVVVIIIEQFLIILEKRITRWR